MSYRIVVKNTIYQVLARVVSTLCGFFTTILIARFLGNMGYGEYTKIITLIGFFYLFIDFGLNAIYIQIDPEGKKFSNIMLLRVILSVLFVVSSNVVVFILPFHDGIGYPPEIRLGIFLYSLSIISQGVTLSSSVLFQMRHRYDFLFLSSAAGSIVSVILVVLLVSHASLSLLMAAFLFSSVITAFLSFLFTKEKLVGSLEKDFCLTLIKKAWPVGVMLVVNLIYFRADIFLLSFFRPTQDVGVYGLAYRFFDFLLALPLFLSNSLYPFMLKEKERKGKLLRLTNSYLLLFLLASVLVVIPFWFISPLFTLIKQDFASSIVPFRILLLSLPIFFVTSLLQWVLISLAKQTFLLRVYVLSAICNIVLNMLFIPQYGYFASAVLTVVSEAMVLVFLFIYTYRSLYNAR